MSGIIAGVQQRVVLRTREMQLLEAHHGRPMDELLRDLYERQGLGIEEIGARLNLTKGTVSRWLAHFGIQTRRRKVPA